MNITSKANPRVKQLVELRSSAVRKELHRFLVEGGREIRQALDHGFRCLEVYVDNSILGDNKIILDQIKTTVPTAQIYFVTSDVFAKIAMRSSVEGLLAVFEPAPARTLEKLRSSENILVLSGLEKPGNLGAILRTADGLGFRQIICSQCETDIYNPNCIRASLGAVFTLDIYIIGDDNLTIKALKEGSWSIYPLYLDPSSQDLFTTKLIKPSALVIGSEARGLSDAWSRAADQLILIPMLGKIDSLNASAAAAIAMAILQRSSGFN